MPLTDEARAIPLEPLTNPLARQVGCRAMLKGQEGCCCWEWLLCCGVVVGWEGARPTELFDLPSGLH